MSITFSGLEIDASAIPVAKEARVKSPGEAMVDRAVLHLDHGHYMAAIKTLCDAIAIVGNEHGIDARAEVL
jgi:hypothetical protein